MRDPKSAGGENLRSYGSEIVLEPAPWLAIDTHRFDASVKELLAPREDGSVAERIRVLEGAIESYAGPFLDGEDADWVLEERERLHSLFVRATSELVCIYGAFDRYDEAIAAARRIIAADPFRESVLRKLIVLLVLNGQRADAIRQYDRWSASFRRELGIDPMPQTVRLAQEIRSGQIFEMLDEIKMQYFSDAKARSRSESSTQDMGLPATAMRRSSPAVINAKRSG
jgi:DNA-binding SARP family transcriptional activator